MAAVASVPVPLTLGKHSCRDDRDGAQHHRSLVTLGVHLLSTTVIASEVITVHQQHFKLKLLLAKVHSRHMSLLCSVNSLET